MLGNAKSQTESIFSRINPFGSSDNGSSQGSSQGDWRRRYSSARSSPFQVWYEGYKEYHPTRSHYALNHTFGFVYLMYVLISSFFSNRTTLKSLLTGIFWSYLITHTWPALSTYLSGQRLERGWFGGHCKYCLFSKDVFRNPLYAFWAEYEMFKEHLIYYVITARGTNCMSHLNTDSDRSTAHIFKTVKKSLEDQYNSRH